MPDWMYKDSRGRLKLKLRKYDIMRDAFYWEDEYGGKIYIEVKEMAKDQKKDALALLNVDTKELGKAVLEAAKDSQRKDSQEFVVKGVKGFLADIGKYRAQVEELQKLIDRRERQIEAIKAGEFELRGNFEFGTPVLVFADKELNDLNPTGRY